MSLTLTQWGGASVPRGGEAVPQEKKEEQLTRTAPGVASFLSDTTPVLVCEALQPL